MSEKNNIFDFSNAASVIKDAIVRSRYQAAKLVNKELLGLYYAVGKFVSENSRGNVWGQGAIRRLSDSLQRELPGLRGFSEVSIKRMRLFYESWQPVFLNRPLTMDDLRELVNYTNRPLIMGDLYGQDQNVNRPLPTDDLQIFIKVENALDLELLAQHIICFIVGSEQGEADE